VGSLKEVVRGKAGDKIRWSGPPQENQHGRCGSDLEQARRFRNKKESQMRTTATPKLSEEKAKDKCYANQRTYVKKTI